MIKIKKRKTGYIAKHVLNYDIEGIIEDDYVLILMLLD